MKAPKFLIVNGEIRMANVEFHYELLPKSYIKISGGGRYYVDEADKRIILYGSSNDYKSASRADILNALPISLISPFYEGYKFYISSAEWQSDAMKDCKHRQQEDWLYA